MMKDIKFYTILQEEVSNEKYNKYRRRIDDIKDKYKNELSFDLERIQKEKRRIEMKKQYEENQTVMGYLITIVVFVVGIVLSNIPKGNNEKFFFGIIIIYGLAIILFFGYFFIKINEKIKIYNIIIEALIELEQEKQSIQND